MIISIRRTKKKKPVADQLLTLHVKLWVLVRKSRINKICISSAVLFYIWTKVKETSYNHDIATATTKIIIFLTKKSRTYYKR
jgi:hypothetical protein